MKHILVLLALILALSTTTVSTPFVKPPKGFNGKLYAGTLALYGIRGEAVRFLCTATPYEKFDGGYKLISAGHCVELAPPDVTFAVADTIGGTLHPIVLVKARYDGTGTDFSMFDLFTTEKYPVAQLDDDKDLRVGDKTINPNFGGGVSKQMSHGVISSDLVTKSLCSKQDCPYGFMVQQYGMQGSSGSLVYSERTHKAIGVVVYIFDGPIGLVIEPISGFKAFLDGPDQPRAEAAKEPSEEDVEKELEQILKEVLPQN